MSAQPSPEGRWFKILHTIPVLPEIPGVADRLKSRKVEFTADQIPTYAGEFFDPDRFPVVSRLVLKYFETPGAFELFCIKPVHPQSWNRPLTCAGLFSMGSRNRLTLLRRSRY